MHILIVEDEKGIVDFLKQGLEEENYTVSTAFDGAEGLKKALELPVDLVLLDWMLPKMQGIEVCKNIRNEKSNLPIIFLTAKDTVQETIEGLKAGANDYIKKPFSFEELLERIKIHFRAKDEAKILTLGNITIDKSKFQVLVDNNEISLTQREFELLEYLIKNKDRVLSETTINSALSSFEDSNMSNVVNVYIYRLRNKIDKNFDKKLIKTVRGIGFKISDN